MSGLYFRKLDLHVHTPASKCYIDKSHMAQQIVQSANEKGFNGIAITDHNTAEWIDQIKDAAEESGLVVFPGVELSLEQGHLVALFDPSCTQKDVEGLLGTLDIKPAEFGQPETICTKNVYEVVEKIHERGGLAILAHIDDYKGIFHDNADYREGDKVSVPASLRKILNEAEYDAVECTGEQLPGGFDTAHQIKRYPAFYQASDNPDIQDPKKHSFAGIGHRYSWFKLDQMDIEGLRQCFADPEVRIQIMGQHKDIGYPKITGMQVGSAGFLGNQVFEFHQGLNSLIGGKGVGKSLAIEMLRFCLQQPSRDENLKSDHLGKLDKRLEAGNWVKVEYQLADGTPYRIRRTFMGKENGSRGAQLEDEFACENLTTGEPYTGDIPRMFPILAYSQTEVIKIAENKSAQLELIDRFIDTHQHEQEIEAIRSKLRENDTELADAIRARDALDSCLKEIQTLKAKIASINKSLANELFDVMKEAEVKNAVFENQQKFVEQLVERIRDWQDDLKDFDIPALNKGLSKDSAITKCQDDASNAKKIVKQALSDAVPQLMSIMEDLEKVQGGWMPEFKKVLDNYKKLLKEIGGDREAKEKDRKKLQSQLDNYSKEEQRYLSASKKLPDLLKARNELLDQLERAYREKYDTRKSKYDQIADLSDGKLQLLLDHAADRSSYAELLSDLLKGGQNSPSVADRNKIAKNVQPRRLIQLVLDRNKVHLSDEAELTELWAERIIEKLWSSEDFSEVLALQHNNYPADVPSIRFHKEGGQYDDLTELSVGQKCTALLIIALCDGEMPIVIDQPEDALDVISVWEDIAKKLRRGKNSRQFILTTHNSSVAVAADSDQFIVLKAGANSGRVVASGAIDRPEVKKAVIDHLEGGEDPYILRSKKYNIHPEQK